MWIIFPYLLIFPGVLVFVTGQHEVEGLCRRLREYSKKLEKKKRMQALHGEGIFFTYFLPFRLKV